MNSNNINLPAGAVADLRRGETVIDRAPDGVTLQLVGPGAGLVLEFADATNAYLSSSDLDLIENDPAGCVVDAAGIAYTIRAEGASA